MCTDFDLIIVMKRTVYVAFALVLVATFALVAVYFVNKQKSTKKTSDTSSPPVTLEDLGAPSEDPYAKVDTAIYTSSDFAFRYPSTWRPTELDDGRGGVDIGIPAKGISTQVLGYETGNYDDIVAKSKDLVNLVKEDYIDLVDRKGYMSIVEDPVMKIDTIEFYAPGRTINEVLVLRVVVDKKVITGDGLDRYLKELFRGLTVVSK